MKIKGINCDDVVVGYLTAALWASTVDLPTDGERPEDGETLDVAEDHPLYEVEQGAPIDSHFGFEDLTEDAVREAKEVCAKFGEKLAGTTCEDCDDENDWTESTVWEALVEQSLGEDYIGHDIWLTRNGHGAGFWDRGYTDHVDRLACEVCKELGERNVWISEDGKLSFES